MYIFPLDSVRVRRGRDSAEEEAVRLQVAENALKATVIRGDKLHFGEPQLIDNGLILSLANDSAFLGVLNNLDVHFCLRKDDAGRLPQSLLDVLFTRIEKNWYPSAWSDALRGPGVSTALRNGERVGECSKVDLSNLEGLRNLQTVVGNPSSIREAVVPPSGVRLSKLLRDTVRRLERPDIQALDDPRSYARQACGEAAKMLRGAMEHAKSLGTPDARTPMVECIAGEQNNVYKIDTLPEWIALNAVDMSYNCVVARSLQADTIWASDHYAFIDDSVSGTKEPIEAAFGDYLSLLCPNVFKSYWHHSSVESDPDSFGALLPAESTLDDVKWSSLLELTSDAKYRSLRQQKDEANSVDMKNERTEALLSYTAEHIAELKYKASKPEGSNWLVISFLALMGGAAGDAAGISLGGKGETLIKLGMAAGAAYIGSGLAPTVDQATETLWKGKKSRVVEATIGQIRADPFVKNQHPRKR